MDRHRVVGEDGEHDGVRADHGAAADPHARPDDDVLAEPRAVADLDRPDTADALFDHGVADLLEGMHVIGDVNVPRHEHLPAETDRAAGGKDAAARHRRTVTYDDGDIDLAVSLQHLQPGAAADEDVVADCDPSLAADSRRR